MVGLSTTTWLLTVRFTGKNKTKKASELIGRFFCTEGEGFELPEPFGIFWCGKTLFIQDYRTICKGKTHFTKKQTSHSDFGQGKTVEKA